MMARSIIGEDFEKQIYVNEKCIVRTIDVILYVEKYKL